MMLRDLPLSEYVPSVLPDGWRMAHICRGRKAGSSPCAMRRFPEDNAEYGEGCGRMSVALCDAPGCDKPVCELHRTRHTTKPEYRLLQRA